MSGTVHVELAAGVVTLRLDNPAHRNALGMITRALPADMLEAEVASVIDALLAASPEAIAQTKQLVWKIEDMDYRSALAAGVNVRRHGQ